MASSYSDSLAIPADSGQPPPPNIPEVFVRGINKRATRDAIIAHFSSFMDPSSAHPFLKWTDFPKQERTGHCWLQYEHFEDAKTAVRSLHHSDLLGTTLSVTLESKIDQEFYFPLSTTQTAIIQRRIRVANDAETSTRAKKQRKASLVSYSRNGVLIDGAEYPTPQGVYLRKLLETRHTCSSNDTLRLFDVIMDNKFGTHHTKELSESMAIMNALSTLGRLTDTNWLDDSSYHTQVYVLGDGKIPFTAATMAIYMPGSWQYVSIDPIMNFDVSEVLGPVFTNKISVESMKSEDYAILATKSSDPRGNLPVRSVVIACHSHAPLQEFWDRVPQPKYCVAMPCCKAEWSALSDAPVHVYDDFEVFSPKRKIFLYHVPC
jgi:hypothetical protein